MVHGCLLIRSRYPGSILRVQHNLQRIRESEMTETKIGSVSHYFTHLHVAGVVITDGELNKGDTIHIKGHTSDFEQVVESMQIDHQTVEVAKPGDQIGLAVIDHAREHDTVYKVT